MKEMFRQHVPAFQASEDKYDDMNITNLRKRARELSIPRYSTFKNTSKGRRDLAELIRQAEASTVAPAKKAPAKKAPDGSPEDWLTYCQRRPEMCSLLAVGGLAAGLSGYYALTLLRDAALSAVTSALYYGVGGILAVGTGAAGIQAFRYRNTIWIRKYNQSKAFAKMELHELQAEVERLKEIQCKWYTLNLSQEQCDTNKDLLDVATETLSFLNDKKEAMKFEVEEVLTGARQTLGNDYDKVFNGKESNLSAAWSELSRPKAKELSNVMALIHDEILASLDSEQAKADEKKQHAADVLAIQRRPWKELNERQRAKLAGAISRRIIDKSLKLRIKVNAQRRYDEYLRVQQEIIAEKVAAFEKNQKRIYAAFDKKNKEIYEQKDESGNIIRAKDLIRYKDDPQEKMNAIEQAEKKFREEHVLLMTKWIKLYRLLAEYIRDNKSELSKAKLRKTERLFDSERRPSSRLLNANDSNAIEFMLSIPRQKASKGIEAIESQMISLGIDDEVEDVDDDQTDAIELNTKLVDLMSRLENKVATSKDPKKYIAALAVLESDIDEDTAQLISDLDMDMNIGVIAKILAPEAVPSKKSANKKKKSKARSRRTRR
jgi:hypothetical protein